MAQIVTITNPLTGQPAQVDQLEHTAQEIDDAISRALPGGAIDTALQNKENSFSVLPLNKGGTGSNTYTGARENLGFKRIVCPAGQSVSVDIANEYTYILSASDNLHKGAVMIQINSAARPGLIASAELISLSNWSYSISNGKLILSETGGSFGAGIGVSHIAWNQGW